MSSKYKFRDQESIYFVTCTFVYWMDLLIRNEYREIIIESIKYNQNNKGLEVYGWCLMTSHIHLIIVSNREKLEDIMQSFKTITSRQLKEAIKNNSQESRKEWLLWMMERAGKQNKHNGKSQLWIEGNHPIALSGNSMIEQKLDYIHNNPVEAGFVDNAEDWFWSSARDYSGKKGMLNLLYLDSSLVVIFMALTHQSHNPPLSSRQAVCI